MLHGQVSNHQPLSHDGMPDGSRPDAADDCPIIFEIPDGSDPADEEQAMQLWQEEVGEEMQIEPPSEGTVAGACCDLDSAHTCIPAQPVAGSLPCQC